MPKETGAYVRRLRNKKRLTLKNLSKDLVSYSELGAFERGKIEISFKTLLAIIDRLKLTPSEFFQFLFLSQKIFLGSQTICSQGKSLTYDQQGKMIYFPDDVTRTDNHQYLVALKKDDLVTVQLKITYSNGTSKEKEQKITLANVLTN
ncbi:helix-turn-helix domain-containing protein [Enterococcus timonensis]|uniref:helix-turn-helix domain-containing protein n=1 Tax=Enterococcus timonensis TaxID=1852364 RepID=UPI0008D96D92|nr:helix-turn-helix transcriptional regulator [Enterococcus timonensis]